MKVTGAIRVLAVSLDFWDNCHYSHCPNLQQVKIMSQRYNLKVQLRKKLTNLAASLDLELKIDCPSPDCQWYSEAV